MKEPSVLDYVKSKITFWKPSSIVIPAPEETRQEVAAQEGMAQQELAQAGEDGGSEPASYSGEDALAGGRSALEMTTPAVIPVAVQESSVSTSGALLALGALIMALIAQLLLEPPGRAALTAGIIYGFSAVLIGFAYVRSLMIPAAIPEDQEDESDIHYRAEKRTVNRLALAVGLVLMVVAFLLFVTPPGQEVPVFNAINTTLWVLSIGYIVLAFYVQGQANRLAVVQRLAAFVKQPGWKITISRWTVLVLLATALVLFFRFYRLNSVPLDPVSDHAEKLLDVNDVLNGQLRVFFPRNTGREAFQFYWTVLIIKLFHTGVTFFSLKLGTALIGLLALYYMYRLGKEIGNRWVALLAVVFCGFSYWAQTQARIGLRFTLYPAFYAPMLFYLIRGLRATRRNDFIWAGLWMGLGLQGYTSYRIVPFVALAGFVIYILHQRSPEMRRFALMGLGITALVALAAFLPLFRFTLDRPDMVAFRSLTRVAELERPLPGAPLQIFFANTWAALVMFFWDNGDVWVHSIPHRPAMDVISAALFFLGVVLVALRYIRKRNWIDLFMLVSIPLLLLPSILSLAFPNENPNLNRTAGAYVPAFLLLGIGLEALLGALHRGLAGRWAVAAPALLGLGLVLLSAQANYNLVFNLYNQIEAQSGWNTPEMGAVVRRFDEGFGQNQDAWVVAYDYWVDTRLVGIEAGYPTRDMAINRSDLSTTVSDPRSKLFLVNSQDTAALGQLQSLYPEGRYWLYPSSTQGKDFVIFLVPPKGSSLPQGAVNGLLH